MQITWNGKPVPPEQHEMVLELTAEIDRLEAEVAKLRRGYCHGGARPPHTKPKSVEDYGRAPL